MIIPFREPRETGRDYALRTLTDNIIHLGLTPGSKVSENELSAKLGLSRTPVREALMELGKVCLVDIQPQRRSVISLIDYDLVDEAGVMRKALECVAVEKAARQITDKQKTALEENIVLQKYYLSAEHKKSLWDLDNAFHELLFQIAGCSMTYRMMTGFTVHFDRVRNMSLGSDNDPQLVQDHCAITQAVCQGDVERAQSIMRTHLGRYLIDRERLCAEYPAEYFTDGSRLCAL